MEEGEIWDVDVREDLRELCRICSLIISCREGESKYFLSKALGEFREGRPNSATSEQFDVHTKPKFTELSEHILGKTISFSKNKQHTVGDRELSLCVQESSKGIIELSDGRSVGYEGKIADPISNTLVDNVLIAEGPSIEPSLNGIKADESDLVEYSLSEHGMDRELEHGSRAEGVSDTGINTTEDSWEKKGGWDKKDGRDEHDSQENVNRHQSVDNTQILNTEFSDALMAKASSLRICRALQQNYMLLKWSADCANAEMVNRELQRYKDATEKEVQTDNNGKERDVHMDAEVQEQDVHMDFEVPEQDVHMDAEVPEQDVHMDAEVPEQDVQQDNGVRQEEVRMDNDDVPDQGIQMDNEVSDEKIKKTLNLNVKLSDVFIEAGSSFRICQALHENYILLKWSVHCSYEEAILFKPREALSPEHESVEGSLDSFGINELLSEHDQLDTNVAIALETEYCLMKQSWLSQSAQTLIITELSTDCQITAETVVPETDDPGSQNINTDETVGDDLHLPAEVEICGDEDLGRPKQEHDLGTDLFPEAGNLFVNEEDEDWGSWSSGSSMEPFSADLVTQELFNETEHGDLLQKKTIDQETQADIGVTHQDVQTDNDVTEQAVQTDYDVTEKEVQTDNEVRNEEVQTDGELVVCCQCSAFSFKPLGDQFVMRLKDEMSQRISLENLIRIVEKDAWKVRQELMDEREGVIRLQAEASDLKGNLTHAEHVSAELKTRNDELETSLEGARNMINKLEQQISNTTYFNSGIDYMLEAKLSKGRAVEALSKVEALQNELLHSQSEVNTLLEQISQLSRLKNEMVSKSVHQELLQIADDRVKDADLRVLQLENEVFALKEKNKQLQSLSSSDEKTSSMMSSTTPYKFMFNEQIDPYKEVLALKEDMLNLKAQSLAYLPYTSPGSSYTSMYSSGTGSYHMPSSVPDSTLPELRSMSASDNTEQTATILSEGDFTGSPLIATGSGSEDSDWSDEDEGHSTLNDAIKTTDGITAVQESLVGDVLYALPPVTIGERLKPAVPPKPRVRPKPTGIGLLGLTGLHTPAGITFSFGAGLEGAASFDEKPVPPHLSVIRKPRGPTGRQRPAKYNDIW